MSDVETATRPTPTSAPAGSSAHDLEPPEQEADVTVAQHDKPSTTQTEQETAEGDGGPAPPLPPHRRAWSAWQRLYARHSFLLLVVFAILLAYAYPPLGAVYLVPDVTATWLAVIFIFVLSGMGIKTEEFAKAFTRLSFNAFVQLFNFGAVSGLVFGVSRLLVRAGALPQTLADGMTICASLPITVNMVLVLTKSAGGDEPAAIFNAAVGNLAGVFLSPALILGYLGVSGTVDLAGVFFKLGCRVVLPLAVGQLLRNCVPPVRDFVARHKKRFKKAQECCLVFIVYTVFCKTFRDGSDVGVGDVAVMIAVQFCMLGLVMTLAWTLLRLLFRDAPRLQAMGLFGCTHKTVAMGVPLINAIYEADPRVGLYTLPLLIWHPMQLVLGTAVAPRVAAYVRRREGELRGDARDEEGPGGAAP